MMMTYEQARADHTYLWETYTEAYDMSGGYVDQDDLARLLKAPTKTTARKCYVDQIHHWFEEGPDESLPLGEWWSDPEVRAIAQRHGASEDLLT